MSDKTLFILGAGFSRHAGMPLVQQLRECVFAWLKRIGPGDPHVSVHLRRLSNWPEYPVGKFLAGLQRVDPGDNRGFEEWMADLLKSQDEEPACVQTYHVLRYACAKLLWEKETSIATLPGAYLHFAQHVRRGLGVVSFNWDLICERALQNTNAPWGYSAIRAPIPVIKPHGSLNWTNHLQRADTGSTPHNSPEFIPIAPESTISYSPARPFEDPLSDLYSDDMRCLTFPGDLESVDSAQPRTSADQERLWTETRGLIAAADRIVFIGYSLPRYDAFARGQLQAACKGKSIIACNPSTDVLSEFKTLFGYYAVKPILAKFEESPFAKG